MRRDAVIAGRLKMNRTEFGSDLKAMARDSEGFSKKLRSTLEGATTNIKLMSDTGLAAQVKKFRGEMLKAGDEVSKIAGEARRKAMEGIFGGPVRMQATGLSLKKQEMPEFTRIAGSQAIMVRTSGQLAGASKTLSTNLNEMRGGATNAGMGMLMLSQAIDDAQYGFKGIVNNIAPLALALGAKTGVAGALTVAAVALNIGIEKFKTWTGHAAEAASVAKAAADHAERLAAAVERAGEAGQAQGRFAVDTVVRQDRGRANEARMAAIERGDANFADPEGAAMRDASGNLQLAQKNLKQDQESLAKIADEITGVEADLKRLEEQEKMEADRWAAKKERADKADRMLKEADQQARPIGSWIDEKLNIPGWGVPQINMGEFPGMSEINQKRRAELQARLPGLKEAQGMLSDRSGQGVMEVAEQQQNVRQEAMRTAQKKADEMVKGASAGLKAAADWATDSQKKVQNFLNIVTTGFDAASKSVGESLDRIAENRKNEAATRDRMDKDLEISSLRAMGKGKEADALEREQRKQDLMSGPARYTPEQAEEYLNKQDAIRDGERKASGRKTIKGAKSKNMETGIDGQFHSGSALDAFAEASKVPLNGYGQTQNPLDAAKHTPRTDLNNKRAEAANAAAKLRNGPQTEENRAMLEEQVKLLRSIDAALKNQQSVKEKVRN